MMKMLKGEYYIGDPCYIIPKGDWEEFCNVYHGLEDEDEEPEDCCFGYKGHFICVDYTTYGDGTYYDADGNKYSVDSGNIGCIPKVLWDKSFRKKANRDHLNRHAQFVKFDSDFECKADNGSFVFGHVIIETGYDCDNDDEYCPDCGKSCCGCY